MVLLVRQDKGLGRHHLQVSAPRSDPGRRVHLQRKKGNYYPADLVGSLSDEVGSLSLDRIE